MHDLEACIFKYITVSAFHIYAQRGEDVAKRGNFDTLKMANDVQKKEVRFSGAWVILKRLDL